MIKKMQLNKVAEVTALFWLTKIIATTLGETFGDFISMSLNLGYAIGILVTLVLFLIALTIQQIRSRYSPIVYWAVIIGTTTVGTEISDFMDRSLHMGYAMGSLVLTICLALTLLLWFRKFKSLDVYPIYDRKKEFFYWTAILFSNSLGTAFGDFLSDNLQLSYLQGAMITGAIIIAVILLHYFTKLNQIVLFWIAFIFTRPFGATFGDFLTKPVANGGLNLDRLQSSLISAGLIAILIYFQSRKHRIALQKEGST